MTEDEYMRLIGATLTLDTEDDAVILLKLHGGDVTVSTFGEPRPLTSLKGWAYKWLGGREEVKR